MKPIKITPEMIEQLKQKFSETVTELLAENQFDAKVTVSADLKLTEKHELAHVVFTPEAYTKMMLLIYDYPCEVAWHGLVDRIAPHTYKITDIIVYPQYVSAGTVTTDQEAYQKFLMNLPDETFDRMHMQGHSHVRFAVTPSGVDITHQQQIVKQLSGEAFYIFMIWNKNSDSFMKIFDLKDNIMYDDDDIIYDVVNENGFSLLDFVTESKKIATQKEKVTTQVYTGTAIAPSVAAVSDSGKAAKATEQKTKTKTSKTRVNTDKYRYSPNEYYDDDDDFKRLYYGQKLYDMIGT